MDIVMHSEEGNNIWGSFAVLSLHTPDNKG